MNDFIKLIKHLENLKQNRVKTATFDVDWLLNAVKSRPQLPPLPRNTIPVIMDGGAFGADNG